MGWIAYKLKRINNTTGDELGEIVVRFPKVEKQFPVIRGYKTLNDLLSYPDFPLDANVMVHGNAGITHAQNFGFGQIIDVSQYEGEKWLMPGGTGAAITFWHDNDYKTYVEYVRPNNQGLLYNTYISTASWVWTTEFFPCYVTEPLNNQRVAGALPSTYIVPSGAEQGKLYYDGSNVPEYLGVNYYEFFDKSEPVYETTDPYDDGGTTEPGGGTGDFDGTGDEIAIPDIPTLSAVDAGFITIFNPSLPEMNELASYMWSDLFDVDGWKKIFADPMGAILGLSIVPVAVPSGGTRAVSVGNISTGVNMTVAASQYVVVDCGTLNVNEFWGAYLDYDPYTKAEIYLPYIGTHALATDDIMNKPVHVVYHVDILSGACCAYVQCGGTVLYSFVGQCASSIPITGDNWTNVINGALSIAGSIGSMVATGGASAPMAIGNIASTAVNSMKPTVEKSGSMGGTGGMLGVQTPYIILTRPRQAVPKRQNEFVGYPSFITELLGDLTGYTEIEHIHLENVPATEPELSEIESLLKSGVIF